MNSATIRRVAEWFLRIALAVAFLSAVADRFGLWGKPGAAGVAWGDWQHFQSYADQLNSWLPAGMRAPAAWLATIAEVLLAFGLLIPIGTRWTAAAAGALLCAFALSMTFALSPKAPLDYSVWTAAAAAFFLAASNTKRTETQSADQRN